MQFELTESLRQLSRKLNISWNFAHGTASNSTSKQLFSAVFVMQFKRNRVEAK
jgi:hypothetical protein